MVATFDLMLNIVADIKSDLTRMQKRMVISLNVIDAKIEKEHIKEVTTKEEPQVIDESPEPGEDIECEAASKEAGVDFGDIIAITQLQIMEGNNKADEHQLFDEMPKSEIGVIGSTNTRNTTRKYMGLGLEISQSQPQFVRDFGVVLGIQQKNFESGSFIVELVPDFDPGGGTYTEKSQIGEAILMELSNCNLLNECISTTPNLKVVPQYSTILPPLVHQMYLEAHVNHDLVDLGDESIMKEPNEVVDSIELVEGLIFNRNIIHVVVGFTKGENFKTVVIQYKISPPKMHEEQSNVIAFDSVIHVGYLLKNSNIEVMDVTWFNMIDGCLKLELRDEVVGIVDVGCIREAFNDSRMKLSGSVFGVDGINIWQTANPIGAKSFNMGAAFEHFGTTTWDASMMFAIFLGKDFKNERFLVEPPIGYLIGVVVCAEHFLKPLLHTILSLLKPRICFLLTYEAKMIESVVELDDAIIYGYWGGTESEDATIKKSMTQVISSRYTTIAGASNYDEILVVLTFKIMSYPCVWRDIPNFLIRCEQAYQIIIEGMRNLYLKIGDNMLKRKCTTETTVQACKVHSCRCNFVTLGVECVYTLSNGVGESWGHASFEGGVLSCTYSRWDEDRRSWETDA